VTPAGINTDAQPSAGVQEPPFSVAVVGAGVSGLSCARELAVRDFDVTVFEKSRGIGGRVSTRRTGAGLHFDHGAQYFTVKNESFAAAVDLWRKAGLASPWEGRIRVLDRGSVSDTRSSQQRFVGVPKMNAPCKWIAEGLEVKLSTHVELLQRSGAKWRLLGDDRRDLGEFDSVVVSVPAPQTRQLVEPVPFLREAIESIEMQPCWAVMVAFEQPLRLPFEGAFVNRSALSWIANSSSKPGRISHPECWVLHGSAEWSDQHLEQPPEAITPQLIEAFFLAIGRAPVPPVYQSSHRWRYAIPPDPLSERCLWDAEASIGVCGDWCAGPRVEGAYLSGHELAQQIITSGLRAT